MSWLKVTLETSIHYSHFFSSLKNVSGFLQRQKGTRNSQTQACILTAGMCPESTRRREDGLKTRGAE